MFNTCAEIKQRERSPDDPEPEVSGPWQWLFSPTVPQDELPSLIETIFSDEKMTKMIDNLQESDAQAFIDVIDGVRHHSSFPKDGAIYFSFKLLRSVHQALDSLNLASRIRNKCMKSLYNTCARYSLLPRSLRIELCYDPMAIPHSRGGFSDVWKGEYRGLEVGVKVLRTSTQSDLQKITRVSSVSSLVHSLSR